MSGEGGRILYLDLVGGASGDMLLAALIDAGASIEAIESGVASVGLEGVKLRTTIVHPAGLRARSVEVVVGGRALREGDGADHDPAGHGAHGYDHEGHGAHGHDHEGHGAHRPYHIIRDRLLCAKGLDDRTRRIALDAFLQLAEAEAEVHGQPVDEVEFHEVGSEDAIVDVVGVASAITALHVEEIVTSPVPIGRGLSRSAHGPLPLPGPATLYLLRGVPIEGTSLVGETITPTGAALLRAITTEFGVAPPMVLEAVGVGAGRRTWPDRPNIVRALVGRRSACIGHVDDGECIVQANIDDMSPEHLGALNRALFRAGALDVWSSAIAMKKDRTGALVSALVRRTLVDVVAAAFFVHSTTLGVRFLPISRIRAERRVEEADTRYGRVRVKISERPHGPPLVSPEFDDCERLAEAGGVSVRAVSEAALRAVWARSPEP